MEKLGIQPLLLLAQIVNFGVIFVVLSKFLYKPVLKNLNERKKKIEESMKVISDAEEEMRKIEKRKDEAKKESREEAKVIIKNANKQSEQLKAEANETASKELKVMKNRIEKEMEAKYARLEKELTAKTVDIAAGMAEKLLKDVLSAQDHHKVIQSQMKKLKNA